jgi:type IV pilus assembly protein PilE
MATTAIDAARRPTRAQRGVTLIELITVMVVVAILTAIAIPSYRAYVLRTQRTEAKTALLQVSAALERCFTRLNRYDDDDCAAARAPNLPFVTENGLYEITARFPTPTTFELTATPRDGQAEDTDCGSFSIDHVGRRSVGGTRGVDACWDR